MNKKRMCVLTSILFLTGCSAVSESRPVSLYNNASAPAKGAVPAKGAAPAAPAKGAAPAPSKGAPGK